MVVLLLDEVAVLSVPFALTSCIILLVDGDAGVGFAVAVGAGPGAPSAFFVLVVAAFVVLGAAPFTVFFSDVAALVLAFLVLFPLFFASTTLSASSTTFFGRPRFFTTSPVDIVLQLDFG